MVRAPQQSLHQILIADLALARADQMPFVEDDQSNVVNDVRIIAQRKIQFLWRGDNDALFPKSVLVCSSYAAASIKR
ncbi:hypothetical protein C667_02013 [Thauera phenylacetica B4P]|uniref:Uncharacterized protein n=1 Tax=Thauera phenylacetica B4P TaxID=1234382 RepID=N6ZWA9_9RHOO|nr:hypothetical protein C667_02013 [Thauera phenylacetica B4P]